MKKFLFLLLVVAATIARAEDIALPDGRILRHARLAKFYAGEFVIEHDGGIAHIPWAQMTLEYRDRHSFDAGKAAAERDLADQKKIEAQKRAEDEQKKTIEDRLAKAKPSPPALFHPTPVPHDIALGMTQSEVVEIWGPARRMSTIWNNNVRTDALVYKAANLFFEDGRLKRIQR